MRGAQCLCDGKASHAGRCQTEKDVGQCQRGGVGCTETCCELKRGNGIQFEHGKCGEAGCQRQGKGVESLNLV